MFGSANVSASNTSSDASSTLLLPQLGVGWRYWPALGGFHFRLTAYGNLVPSHGFFPWVGIGLGYAL